MNVEAADYDPFSDEVMRDPWPWYAALRRDAPVFYSERYDTWFLSRFEDIWESTTRDVFSAERGVTPEMVLLKRPPPPDPVFSMLDVPRQREYRRMLAPPYSRRAIAGMEEWIRAETRALLAPLAEQGRLDVYGDLAAPLATRVIARLIGMPNDLATECVARIRESFARKPGQVGADDANNAATGRLMESLFGFVVGRRKEGTRDDDDSHVAALLRGEAEGGRLGDAAVVSALYTMLVTGVEVVPLAVANTAVYLERHADERARVVADPALVPAAFAESLRYDQPTNLLGRFVKDPVELRGQSLSPGQGVMFLWASGNRDEAEFEAADRFDLDRRPKRSLSYGHGIHKCIGEHLGNLEGRVLIEELLALAPDYAVAAGAERVYSEFLHGYHAVPIEFAPSANAIA